MRRNKMKHNDFDMDAWAARFFVSALIAHFLIIILYFVRIRSFVYFWIPGTFYLATSAITLSMLWTGKRNRKRLNAHDVFWLCIGMICLVCATIDPIGMYAVLTIMLHSILCIGICIYIGYFEPRKKR